MYLSNMYPSEIAYDDKAYSCAETLFQTQRAHACGAPALARKISNMTDPYQAKASVKNLKSTPGWEAKRDEVMKRIVKLKFDQHDDLRRELTDTQGHL